MPKTSISIDGDRFLINNQLTYADIEGSKPEAHGLLMNARFIQGIFDDKINPDRFARWGKGKWNPARNTLDLIAALPEWYQYGLRAFTVGLQGGGPCFTVDNLNIDNNPFSEDGNRLDSAYAERLDTLIRGADEIGMAVIVSYFYGGQTRFLRDGRAIRNAVTTASNFLRDGGYTNVLIEIANEHDVPSFKQHPLIYYPEGVASLIDLARRETGGMAVSCSGVGNSYSCEIAEASDYILIHGNGTTRQKLHNMIIDIQSWGLNRPIVCNEDSPAVGQMEVTFKTRTSWGYYNNMTKQEPPADWRVTKGEDLFFAFRMGEGIGIDLPPLPEADQYYLQGLEPSWEDNGQRWIRLASLYPENINYVEFFRNGKFFQVSYDEPFSINFINNWLQRGVNIRPDDKEWKAVIYLHNGDVIERTANL